MAGESSIDWFELARRLYEAAGRKSLHINEMAKVAEEIELIPFGENRESFAKKLNNYLSRNARSKSAQFSKVKNKKGGYSRGIYRLKPQKAFDLTPAEAPKVSTQFTGAAGEFAVLSELLFRGFNASKMTVDDGIDIVASKDEKYFHIQVKTANFSEGKPFQASIRQRAFKHSSIVYYIVVLRQPTPVGFVNKYVILPSGDIRRMISQGILKEGASINLRISMEKTKYILAGKVDISHQINDFESIC
ncbi:hypothetical protein MNBD_ALPHA07-594 [hydrothermal vent metagenome]|uniref:HTH HARE-type domain-containing protein n=1 Tax=hydrothermal vent metagenome TaxID=652676 RepID=A0A3B0RZN6_9ZZZZ